MPKQEKFLRKGKPKYKENAPQNGAFFIELFLKLFYLFVSAERLSQRLTRAYKLGFPLHSLQKDFFLLHT